MAILLDGGMGQELVKRGYDSPVIWSARALIEAPDVVREAHEAFIGAGAQVITTSNYSCTPKILARGGQEARFKELVGRARDMANAARDRSKKDVKIAGSLPPLVGTYDPNQVEPDTPMRDIYGQIAETLKPGVDLMICESMTTGREARAAAEAAATAAKPVWVSYILMDSGEPRVRSGETIAEAVKALDGVKVDAVLFNCCSPEAITGGMKHLRQATKLKIGGYANAFNPIPDKYNKERDGRRRLRDDVSPDGYAASVKRWMTDGAEIIGGCCGTGPEHIRKLAALA
jgi:S-methylmethionine-dependent homocysteine/selenocysteine methylase